MNTIKKTNSMHTVLPNTTTCLFCKESVVYSKSMGHWQTTNGQGNVRCYYTVDVA
jgi:transcription elongation factor Elf1